MIAYAVYTGKRSPHEDHTAAGIFTSRDKALEHAESLGLRREDEGWTFRIFTVDLVNVP
jgi:hypothetical protein